MVRRRGARKRIPRKRGTPRRAPYPVIQSLRLAQASGHRELGAHILADMSMQAQYLGKAAEAVELSTAGYDTAMACCSPRLAAKCAAGQGVAYALAGDGRASAQASVRAEQLLARAAPLGERTWFVPFRVDQMISCQLYMARDLGQTAEVQRLGPVALGFAQFSVRRQVMYTSTLAGSWLPAPGNRHADIDHACHLLSQALPALSSLHSTRTLERFTTVRRALATHADRPSVQEFEERYRATITATPS